MTRFRLWLLPALLLCLCACDSGRLDDFSDFATAGSQYVVAFHHLIRQAGSVCIAADSATLIRARNLAGAAAVAGNAAEFRAQVHKEDQQLAAILTDLSKIDQHATALGAYFDSLSKLAGGKLTSSMTTASSGLLTAVGGMNSELGKVMLGATAPLSAPSNSAVGLVVAHFQVRALENQLKTAAPVIDTALSLQEAAIDRIAALMKADLAATLEEDESANILNPYVSPGDLPANWTARREAFLRATVTINNVDSAKSAIRRLHTAFTQLVENKSSLDLPAMLNEINKMAGYAGTIESTKDNAK